MSEVTLVCFGDFCFMLASAGIDVACMIQACPDTGGGAESVLRTSGRFPLLPCPRISAYAHLFISTLEVANSLKRPMWKSHRCSKAPSDRTAQLHCIYMRAACHAAEGFRSLCERYFSDLVRLRRIKFRC
ncbi:uncharacterized protein [Physcomitrium patens]|uniref:uncharacterized protein n=1 Tax=Physcomitrium patens TaxID=3218 RepID=UPI003CCE3FE9